MKEPRRLAERFLLLQPLGEGGETEAWLAQDVEIGELVLLRLLPEPAGGGNGSAEAGWQAVRQVCREARRLAHPNIARVFDVHRDGDTRFLSREYVQGVDAESLAERPLAEAFATFAQVAAALVCAREHAVVHGDLKASKILRDANGLTRVVDFGLSAALRASGAPAPADELSSPQVRAGEAPRVEDDVFSLGALVLSTVGAAKLPAELSLLIGAMCSERREDRPTDMEAVRAAFESAAAAATTSTTSAGAPGVIPVVAPPAPAGVVAPAQTHSDSAQPPRSTPHLPTVGGAPSSAVPDGPEKTSAGRNAIYVVLLAGLAAVALLVFIGLPRLVVAPETADSEITPESQASSEAGNGETPAPAAKPGSDADDPAGEQELQVALSSLVELRTRLEAQAVTRWAGERFAEAGALEARGNAARASGDVDDASRDYAGALSILEQIAARKDDVLAEALAAGDAALAAAELDAARENFELALDIEPDHAAASEGLRRTASLPQVLSHMRAGKRLEDGGSPGAAADEYRQALALDPKWQKARAALARAEAAHGGNEYQRHLSLALVALADSKLKSARTHFERAGKLRPGSPEVADGMARLRQVESSQTIARERDLADKAERAERFEDAAGHYSRILQIQPNLTFAVQGLARTQELARRLTKIEALLADPKQLFEAGALDDAQRLVGGAPASSVPRPGYDDKVQRLRLTIELATTPIPVAFRSDGATEVVIRKVGTLGSFDQREVPLKPGRYVVVGRRDGYRDVLRKISVVPGRETPVVDVRCTDSI